MKAFVTGGTGFIGRRLIEELLAHGYDVVALVRTFDRARMLPQGVHITAGDVTQRATMRAGMRGADVVFHAAALRQVGARSHDRERMHRINVDGTRETLELTGELGVRKVVYTSTAAVFGGPQGRWIDESYRPDGVVFESDYERTKHLAHHEVAVPLQQTGLPLVIVCPSVVYGPGDLSRFGRLMGLYARRRLPIMIGEESVCTWVYVDDVAAGHRLAAEKGHPGEAYILAGPALNYRQFFAAAERATGLPAPRIWLPTRWASVLARGLRQVSPSTAAQLPAIAQVSSLARADKAKHELGWNARPVELGITETIKWLKYPQHA